MSMGFIIKELNTNNSISEGFVGFIYKIHLPMNEEIIENVQ